MILKERAGVDFEKYIYNKFGNVLITEEYCGGGIVRDLYLNEIYEKLPDQLINTFIVEWLDSVGIYISLNVIDFFGESAFESWVTHGGISRKNRPSTDRITALEVAISVAGDIYNKIKENDI